MLGTFVVACGLWVAAVVWDEPQDKPQSAPQGEASVRALLVVPQPSATHPTEPLKIILLDENDRPTSPGTSSPQDPDSGSNEPAGESTEAATNDPEGTADSTTASPGRTAGPAPVTAVRVAADPFERLMDQDRAAIARGQLRRLSATEDDLDGAGRSSDADKESSDDDEDNETDQSDDSSDTPITELELSYDFLGEPIPVGQLADLRDRIRRPLVHYYQRPEATSDYSPWGVMHALIAFGADTSVYAGRDKVNAIGWLAWNGKCRGQQLMSLRNGELSMAVGPGLQGHEGQFLAMLAQSYVPADYELRVGSKRLTVQDLIEYEKRTCRPRTELTFKLIALSHYLPIDATWQSDDGEDWSIERLIREEIAQPVIGAACGGTHRLMGLSYAVRYRRAAGLSIDGEWARAALYVNDFQRHAIGQQNRDASFSTKWLERREARDDDQRRIQTTGHILEWLVYSLPEEQLRSPEIVRTVTYLANLLWNERSTEWEIGPKGHALHALNLYDQRVFGARIGQGGPRMDWR